jgi:Uma2 family endonuclease
VDKSQPDATIDLDKGKPWNTPMGNTARDLGAEARMTRDEYQSWVDAQPTGRFERIDGEVVAMAPERGAHLRVKRDVLLALLRGIAAAGLSCEALPDGGTVQVEDGNDYEPDAVVTCGERMAADATVVPDPVIVVEVLSPSTRGGDLTRKLVGYFKLPSVRHYLIFWAERPQVIHHRRRDDGEGIETRVVTSGAITLDPPGITISIEDVYGS